MSQLAWVPPKLNGHVAVIAGATRGAGRGIATELGCAGAAVYCTGRSVAGERSDLNRPETITETAEIVTSSGGVGIPVRVDHTDVEQVATFFQRVDREQEGRLDLLVTDIWGGDYLTEWEKPFWELDIDKASTLLQRAVNAHMITNRYGVPLMVKRGDGLVIEVTDGNTLDYRGNLVYDLAKTSAIRLGYAMNQELKPHGVTAVSLTPGFLRSEAVLDHFGVGESNWQDAVKKDRFFAGSETPRFIGRAVASLCADDRVCDKGGKSLATWELMEEYGFRDVDGRQPHWKKFYDQERAAQQTDKGQPSV